MAGQMRKALFSESNVPPGGVCLSSFVIVRDGGRVLVGKMAKPEIWTERFHVGPKFAPSYTGSGKYVLPARHLSWYESPLEAARGIMKDQVLLEVPKDSFKLLGVQSFVSGDPDKADEDPHWDICFVYQVELPGRLAKSIKAPEWFKDLGFVSTSELSRDAFTRGHGDVLEAVGVIRR